jgi:hypothetical protein
MLHTSYTNSLDIIIAVIIMAAIIVLIIIITMPIIRVMLMLAVVEVRVDIAKRRECREGRRRFALLYLGTPQPDCISARRNRTVEPILYAQ